MSVCVDIYAGGRDQEISRLILSIQNEEARLNLTIMDQPDLMDIMKSYAQGGFWIAQDRNAIVGTIGLIVIGNRGVLKKFFVAEPYRGASGVAASLFARLMAHARQLGLDDIVLDTPAAATRSHRFYSKMGFTNIGLHQLPAGYTYPDRDSLLLHMPLTAGGHSAR